MKKLFLKKSSSIKSTQINPEVELTGKSALLSTPNRSPSRLDKKHTIDDGKPSADLQNDLLRVVSLVENERHLVAEKLLQSCKTRLRVLRKEAETNASLRVEFDNAITLISNFDFIKLEQLAHIFKTALKNATQNEGWIPCHSHNGIISSYRKEADHSLSIKIEGKISGAPLFEQIAVMRETDLYMYWAPFVHKSKKIAELGILDQIGWYEVSVPIFGFVRDACFRAVGCDDIYENGRILVVAQGIQDSFRECQTDHSKDDTKDVIKHSSSKLKLLNEFFNDTFSEIDANDNHLEADCHNWLEKDPFIKSIQIPPKPKGANKGRMEIRFFEGVIDVLSSDKANTRLVANINLNLRFLPQVLIDFCMKKMAGMIMVYIQRAAQKAEQDPEKSPHAMRMRQDNFYREWLLPRFKNYCFHHGWTMPYITALRFKPKSHSKEMKSFSFSGFPNQSSSPKDRDSHLITQSLPNLESPSRTFRTKESILQKNFSSDQLERLRELKSHSRSWDTASREDDMSASESYVSYDGREPSRFETVSILINEPSHWIVLPFLFALMFGSFYALPNDLFLKSSSNIIFRYLVCIPLQLLFFTFQFWSIMELIMVTAFDSIQLPFDRVSTPTIRLYYIDMIRSPLMIFSLSLVILSTTKNLLVEAMNYTLAILTGANLSEDLIFSKFVQQVVYDCKAMMTYSSIFVVTCFVMLVTVSPKKNDSRKRPLSNGYEFSLGQEDDASLEFHPPSPKRGTLRHRRVLSDIGSIDEENESQD